MPDYLSLDSRDEISMTFKSKYYTVLAQQRKIKMRSVRYQPFCPELNVPWCWDICQEWEGSQWISHRMNCGPIWQVDDPVLQSQLCRVPKVLNASLLPEHRYPSFPNNIPRFRHIIERDACCPQTWLGTFCPLRVGSVRDGRLPAPSNVGGHTVGQGFIILPNIVSL